MMAPLLTAERLLHRLPAQLPSQNESGDVYVFIEITSVSQRGSSTQVPALGSKSRM